MQTLDSLKAKGQASLTNLMDSIKEQPDDIKIWGVAAGSAVVGAVAVNAAARGVIAILGTLASTPVSLTVGAVGGGYLGWTYLQKWQAAEAEETNGVSEPIVETISVTSVIDEPVAVAPAGAMPSAEQPIAAADAMATVAAPVEEMPAVSDTDVPSASESQSEKPAIVSETTAPTPAVPDDLEVINGIGPVYAGRLQSAGIQTLVQLAELSPDQVREIIGPLRSGHMIEPEKWIAEARQLTSVDG